jgi:hypothetical protein
LNLVWEHEICQQKGFNAKNTVMIDSSAVKVQLFRDNSLVNRAYELEDVQLIADAEGVIRGPEWHADHMSKLADFVIKMADSVDADVQDWLRHNRPTEYEPTDLLSN